MDLIFTGKGIGKKNGMVMMKTSCGIEGIQEFFEQFKQAVKVMESDNTQGVESNRTPHPSPKRTSTSTCDKNFVPATAGQLRALCGAAKKIRKSVDEVCQHYGVDPNHISKDEARDIISEINDKTGFSEYQRQQRENDISRAWR